MKKMLFVFLAAIMVFALAACGVQQTAPAEEEIRDWSRQSYFTDENENFLSVTRMDDVVDPGWYVGFMNGEDLMEDSYGGILPQEGNTLKGALPSAGSKPEITITISEEGEDGLLLEIEGGESYHFKPYDMPTAAIVVNVNTEGFGNIYWTEGEEAPEIDPDSFCQYVYIGLDEPKTHTFVARPQAGSVFVKWTKNGEDFSTDPQISLLLDESADYVAVFEEDADWQNPVMNFIGNYQCGRASATVECFGSEDAWITIKWGSSAWELTQWDIVGRLDIDTLSIDYSGSTKRNLVYDDNGDLKSEETVYEGGSGTIVFNDDGTFTWHEDLSENAADMVFEWLPVTVEDPEYYAAVTAMEKSAVEEQCAILRAAYLNEDWETIAVYLRYPVSINGTELKNADEFLAFMKDKKIHESDREQMSAETCRDMFFNGEGICLGAGELWITDLSYMTEEPPEMAIIGINGIINK